MMMKVKRMTEMKNDDYKRGYREGFLDGFKAARDNDSLVSPNVPVQQSPIKSCPQCGRVFTDTLGRPIPMAVVCSYVGCPQGITSIQISNTGDMTNMNS